jgi:hypothetical protein
MAKHRAGKKRVRNGWAFRTWRVGDSEDGGLTEVEVKVPNRPGMWASYVRMFAIGWETFTVFMGLLRDALENSDRTLECHSRDWTPGVSVYDLSTCDGWMALIWVGPKEVKVTHSLTTGGNVRMMLSDHLSGEVRKLVQRQASRN